MINIKKIIIILILTLLTNCGYEPIYSKYDDQFWDG